MVVHIYIYEYIFPLRSLWLHLKIEKNYHCKGGKKKGGKYYVIHEENFCWLREKREKKRQHILSQTPLVTALVTRKQDFFLTPHLPPHLSFFPCIYNTYRTRLLNCEDIAGSSLWCKRSWNAAPRRGSWVWGIKRKWEGGKDKIKKSSSDLWCSSNKFTLWQKIHGCNKRVIPALTHAIRWFWPGC